MRTSGSRVGSGVAALGRGIAALRRGIAALGRGVAALGRGIAALTVAVALVAGAPGLVGTAAAASRTYRVVAGDTLTAIAARFGVSPPAIVNANHIVNPNDIIIGTRFVIPSAGASGAGSAGWSSGPGRSGSYVIVAGDTLSAIASRFGVSIADLMAANDLTDPNTIVIGTHLVIPTAGSAQGGSGGSFDSAPSAATGPLASVFAPAPGSPDFPSRLLSHPSRLALRPVFEHWARYYGVAPGLLEGLAWMESGWQSGVVSSTGAVGIGQLEPSTVRFVSIGLFGLSKPLDPRNPTANIEMSAAYLAWMIRAAHGSIANALGGYYQGLGSLYASGPFPSTRSYVLGIGQLWHQFRSG